MKKYIILLCSILFFFIASCQLIPTYYNLQVSLSDAEGDVIITPNSTRVKEGDNVVLTAVPKPGYIFISWSGDIDSAQNPISLKMTQDYSININFISLAEATIKYTLEGSWASYNKTDLFIDIADLTKYLGHKKLSNFKKANYFGLNLSKANREKAILVKFRPYANSKSIQKLLNFGKKDLSFNGSQSFERIIVDERDYSEIPSIIDKLNLQYEIEWAEVDNISKALFSPDDEFFSYQWNFQKIGMPAAWDYTRGETGVIIAVIDTGVYFPLSDLGQTKFVPGYNFVNNTPNPLDDNGHGTHIIGTLAESTNNVIGVAGIAPEIQIMPIKVLGSDGFGNNSDIASGIYFAANNGASIINLSLGGEFSKAIEDAVNYAVDHGVLVVAAAGNEATSSLNFPAALPNVVSVGATNDANEKAPYSNYGTGLDVVAPGGDLTRLLHNQEYGDDYPCGILQQTYYEGSIDYWYFEGTSMAAPHVAGLAALLKSKNKNLTANEIISIIEESASDLGMSGYDTTYGFGIIDAAKALGVPGYLVNDRIDSSLIIQQKEYQKWRIQAAPGVISLTLVYSHANAQIELSLLDSAGTLVAKGVETNATTTLTYSISPSNKGTYYLEVQLIK